MQDEQVLGRLRAWGTLDGGHRNGDDGTVGAVVGGLLRGGEAEAAEGEHECGDACEESGPAPGAAGSEQEQQYTCKLKRKENEEQGCPCVGREHVTELPDPSLEEELRNALDTVLDGPLRKLEVETSVRIRRIKLQGTFVIEDGMGIVRRLEERVSYIILKFR